MRRSTEWENTEKDQITTIANISPFIGCNTMMPDATWIQEWLKRRSGTHQRSHFINERRQLYRVCTLHLQQKSFVCEVLMYRQHE